MFKSKHSGWTWDLRRTPFGGGGGGWNPIDIISPITDPISSFVGTDGGDGGILGELAKIDPGPAIGQGLAELDKGVGQVVPGGWGGVAAITAAILSYGATLPETEAAFAAADAANLAGQGLSQEAIAQNLVASYGMTAEQAAAAATAAAAGGQAAASAATQALPYSEVFDATNLANQGLNASAIQQNIAATGLNDFLAQDIANMAANGLSPEAIAQNLAYSYSNAELAGTGIESLQAQSGMSAADALSNANRAKNIAKLLNQGGGTAGRNISVKNIPTAQQWTQQAAQNFAQATPEQFGGLYEMNKNPFTFSNPLAAALKGGSSGLDVSGSGGTALQSHNLAKLLA